MDLAFKQTSHIANLKPLLYWAKIWSTEELAPYRAAPTDLLFYDQCAKTPWLKHIKSWYKTLCLEDLWYNPRSMSSCTKKTVTVAYWNHIAQITSSNPGSGSLSANFLTHKPEAKFEEYLDQIEPRIAKSLFMKFRFGILALKSYTSNWSSSNPQPCTLCDLCTLRQEENSMHILFFCPAYSKPRQRWIKPLCKNYGFRSCFCALRVLTCDTSTVIVFTVSRFLYAVWVIRNRHSLPL